MLATPASLHYRDEHQPALGGCCQAGKACPCCSPRRRHRLPCGLPHGSGGRAGAGGLQTPGTQHGWLIPA